jgi:hypothetical protein
MGAGAMVLMVWFIPFLGVYMLCKALFLVPNLLQAVWPNALVMGSQMWIALPIALGRLVGLWALPVTLMGSLSLWLFPCAAWFWCRAGTHPREAAVSEPSVLSTRRHSPCPLSLSPALVTGCLGGLVFWVLLSTIGWEGLRAVLNVFPQADIAALVLPVWLLEALVAATVAALTPRFPVIHGLFAAFLTTCMGAGGLSGWFVLRGMGGSSDGTIFRWALLTNGGVPLALLTAWLAARVSAYVYPRGAAPE